MSRDPELLSREERFAGRVFRHDRDRLRLPDGQVVDYDVIRHPGAVAVLPLVTGPLGVVLIRQYRHPVGRSLWEIPAGTLDDPAEGPAAGAGRELLEETGYRAGALAPIGSFFTVPGFCDERMHLFVAWRLEAVADGPAGDPDESIEVHRLPWARVEAMLDEGRIEDAKTLVALGWLRSFLARGR